MAKRNVISRKLNFLYVLPCFAIVSCILTLMRADFEEAGEKDYLRQKSRTLLEAANGTLIQCIPSGIDSFPNDFLSQEDRQKGGVIIHILIATYTCAMIGIVCHDYFVPSLEIISEKKKTPKPPIAGATFMAIGTSAPELFSSITGSFITEGDIGVGTIIGSAVFNIVGVTGMVGIVLWKKVLDIDWYPIARDCIAYGVTVFTLIWIIADNIIHWWEALVLLLIFALYIIVIYFNRTIEIWSRDLVERFQESSWCRCCYNSEESPLLNGIVPEIMESQKRDRRLERDSFSVEFTASKEEEVLRQETVARKLSEILWSGEHTKSGTLCVSPAEGGWKMFWWLVLYPARLIFFCTIPDSRKPKLYSLFPLTFSLSVLWIGVLSYLAVWMVTVIGYTFNVPDSVSGLTILAAGTSIPEIISSIIVAQNGYGNMAISNLVGSNTFDISFCLGAPWLIKTLISEKGYLLVFSSALTYTTATLLITLLAFVLVFVFSGIVPKYVVYFIYE
ncbi:Sodium/potassium/calcium exchanger 5 like protein [Argiope bruennichi]|uniref:Sodium/potassium/calcium exchanger 5 like protein n=1 Tax=Argiope bruennichi TaxID=94029 RepID=A0A8T0E260_ARGBR|nr:Sodium/potassium/calcium exchanger 5 like protein [Argiope bruennichi]